MFILGLLSLAAACLGREARRQRWVNWVRLRVTGMGTSYILLLTAFYVDNGKKLAGPEPASADCVLADPCGRRNTAHLPRSVVAPAGARQFSLARSSEPDICERTIRWVGDCLAASDRRLDDPPPHVIF